MLKLKNAVLVFMIAAVAACGFVSCSNSSSSDDNNNNNNNNNSPATVTLPSTIYGNTYKGSKSVFSATLKVTDASKIYLVGGPASAPTKINVVDQAYTVTKSNDVYTVKTTNDGADFTFTLTINADGTVALGYGAMNVTMSKVLADYVRGTYKGTATMVVMGQTVNFENSSFVITKTDDAVVSLTVPSVTYEAMSMTFPAYTLTNGTVTESSGTYTMTFSDTTTEANAAGKTTTVTSITASVKDNVLTYSASEKYGSMPMAGSFTFTSTSKE